MLFESAGVAIMNHPSLTFCLQIYNIIVNLPAPKPIRQMVTSSTTVLEDVFPETNIWKVLYFVHVLSRELQEQTSAGVADEGFLLHGVRSLVRLTDRHGDSDNGHVLRNISHALLLFLRGTFSISLLQIQDILTKLDMRIAADQPSRATHRG